MRRLEGWFFDGGRFSPERAVDHIRNEARTCGVDELHVEQAGEWWLVAADRDWLPEEESGRTAFERLVHLPQAGVNASRSEVLLTAFAQVVVTALRGNVMVIIDHPGRASEATDRFADGFDRYERVIAFLP